MINFTTGSNSEIIDNNISAIVSSTSEDDKNVELALPNKSNKEGASFNSKAISNSNDIPFENEKFYDDPVKRKQFLYENSNLPNNYVNNGSGENINTKLALENNVIPVCHKAISKSFNNGSDVLTYTNVIRDKKIANIAQHTEVKRDMQWLRNILCRHLPLTMSVLTLLLLSLVILTSVLLTRHWPTETSYIHPKDTNERNHNGLATYIHDGNVSFTLPNKLKITTRLEWLARPVSKTLEPLSQPVPYIIIMETQTANCTVIAHCQFMVKNKQTYDIDSQNKSDISYNYLIGGDGYAYEGVGWNFQGAHTPGYNNRSISIAFIGTYSNIPPGSRDITTANQLITIGVELGYIDPNYKLLGSRQLGNTHNPGKLLFKEIKKWSHWSETP